MPSPTEVMEMVDAIESLLDENEKLRIVKEAALEYVRFRTRESGGLRSKVGKTLVAALEVKE